MGNILIVDDDDAIREALRLLLTDEGHDVAEAADGQAALDLLRTTPERWVVLVDYLLLGMSGQALLAAVAADADLATRHAYIAMPATAHLDAPVADVREALGTPLLRKPFELEEVLAAIAKAEARLFPPDAPSTPAIEKAPGTHHLR